MKRASFFCDWIRRLNWIKTLTGIAMSLPVGEAAGDRFQSKFGHPPDNDLIAWSEKGWFGEVSNLQLALPIWGGASALHHIRQLAARDGKCQSRKSRWPQEGK